MRSLSIGRKSSINPVRISNFDFNDRSTVASEPRPSNIGRPKAGQATGESGIPRPRAGSSSLDRGSIRRSNLKTAAKSSTIGYGQYTTPVTPKFNSKSTLDLPSGVRGRSPSAERASGVGVPHTAKKDTRPLNEKNFQQEMLFIVDNFFRDANQQHLLNPNGSIKPMSLKIFISTTNLLLKLLDLKLELNTNNYIEELPKIGVRLHYIGAITKSWLKTANTMHAWPHVLAWLSWLIEICESRDAANDIFQYQALPFVEEMIDERIVDLPQLQKISIMYQAWNAMDEEKEATLVEQYVKIIADERGYHDENLLATQKRHEETKDKYCKNEKRFNEIDEEFNTNTDKLNVLKIELQNQYAEDESFDKFVADSNVEFEKLVKEDMIFDERIAENHKLQEQLKVDIDHQVLTLEERDAILNDCVDLVNRCKEVDLDIDELDKQNWSLEIKRSNNKEKLNKLMFTYNRDLRNDYDEDLKHVLLPESSLCGQNFKELIIEKLEEINKVEGDYNNVKYKLTAMINDAAKKVEALQNQLKMKQQEKSTRLSKENEMSDVLRQMQIEVNEDKEKFEILFRSLCQTLESKKEKYNKHSHKIELLKNEIIEGKEKLKAVERRRAFLHKTAESFFKNLVKQMAIDINNMADIARQL